MAFTNFMSSTAGRGLRIIAGLALIVIGLAVVGLVPLGAGVANVCLFGPLLGSDLHGNPKSTQA